MRNTINSIETDRTRHRTQPRSTKPHENSVLEVLNVLVRFWSFVLVGSVWPWVFIVCQLQYTAIIVPRVLPPNQTWCPARTCSRTTRNLNIYIAIYVTDQRVGAQVTVFGCIFCKTQSIKSATYDEIVEDLMDYYVSCVFLQTTTASAGGIQGVIASPLSPSYFYHSNHLLLLISRAQKTWDEVFWPRRSLPFRSRFIMLYDFKQLESVTRQKRDEGGHSC